MRPHKSSTTHAPSVPLPTYRPLHLSRSLNRAGLDDDDDATIVAGRDDVEAGGRCFEPDTKRSRYKKLFIWILGPELPNGSITIRQERVASSLITATFPLMALLGWSLPILGEAVLRRGSYDRLASCYQKPPEVSWDQPQEPIRGYALPILLSNFIWLHAVFFALLGARRFTRYGIRFRAGRGMANDRRVVEEVSLCVCFLSVVLSGIFVPALAVAWPGKQEFFYPFLPGVGVTDAIIDGCFGTGVVMGMMAVTLSMSSS